MLPYFTEYLEPVMHMWAACREAPYNRFYADLQARALGVDQGSIDGFNFRSLPRRYIHHSTSSDLLSYRCQPMSRLF